MSLLPRIPPRLFYWLKAALAVGTLAYLGESLDWAKIVKAAEGANPTWIAAALALLPLNVGLETYRWHRLVRRLAPEVGFREALGAVLSGYPLGLVTPGRVGDYVGRALYLRYAGKWELAALTFAERMATLACCLVFGLAVLAPFLLMLTEVASLAWVTVLYAGIAGTAIFLFVLLHPRLVHRALTAVMPSRRGRRVLAVLGQFDRWDARALVGLSAVRYVVFSAQFVLLVRAFDPVASLWLLAAGVALTFFAKSAIPSFTLADLGIREGAAVYFMGMLGIAEAAAFNGAFLVFCVNILVPSLVGLPLMLRWRTAEEPAEASALAAEARS